MSIFNLKIMLLFRFSVAWYPAYTVPEGRSSFKAAFLTYHSLAHFVQGAAGPSVDGPSFPVVGLMSYNAQVISTNNP